MNIQPTLMDFSRMRELFGPIIDNVREHLFISKELGIINGYPGLFQIVLRQQAPIIIDDYRFGVLLKGEIRASINLVERHVKPGTLLFVGPGAIISPRWFSDDVEIYGIALFSHYPMPFATGQMPTTFNGQVRDFQIGADDGDIQTALKIIKTMWHIVHQPDYSLQTVSGLVMALMYHYDGLYRKHSDVLLASQSREQTIFDRFIYLVNQYAAKEHQIGFFAEKMCLTERYLGAVVRNASGTTAKEWIDRAIITRVKVELKHTDKSVLQISDEMNFPNASFFSKYFKRITGQTPLEYRLS